MNPTKPLISRSYTPTARRKIQLALTADLDDWGGAKPLAAFLDSLFRDSELALEGVCRENGDVEDIQYYSDESLRKFFKAGSRERAKIKNEIWRYLDVLKALYHTAVDEFASTGILQEFGFARIEHQVSRSELIIPDGKYILAPKEHIGVAMPALMNVKRSVFNGLRIDLWVSKSGSIDPQELRDFVKFKGPPRSTFELWEGVGYEVDGQANLETLPSLPPPYAAFVFRQPRNRAPGAFVATIKNQSIAVSIQTTLFKADYELTKAIVERDG